MNATPTFIGFTLTNGAFVCRRPECLKKYRKANIGLALRHGIKVMFQRPYCDVCQEPLE